MPSGEAVVDYRSGEHAQRMQQERKVEGLQAGARYGRHLCGKSAGAQPPHLADTARYTGPESRAPYRTLTTLPPIELPGNNVDGRQPFKARRNPTTLSKHALSCAPRTK